MAGNEVWGVLLNHSTITNSNITIQGAPVTTSVHLIAPPLVDGIPESHCKIVSFKSE